MALCVFPFAINMGGMAIPAAFMHATTVMFCLSDDTLLFTLFWPFSQITFDGMCSRLNPLSSMFHICCGSMFSITFPMALKCASTTFLSMALPLFVLSLDGLRSDSSLCLFIKPRYQLGPAGPSLKGVLSPAFRQNSPAFANSWLFVSPNPMSASSLILREKAASCSVVITV